MPWEEHTKMSLKETFVQRAVAPGANMSALCDEFDISRETGHKWKRRFEVEGLDGLAERSRRPRSAPLSTAEDVVMEVLRLREAYPRWGPKKIVLLMQPKLKAETPSVSTVARLLRRFGKIRSKRRRPALSLVEKSAPVRATKSNEVWTVDFKGWWRTRDGMRCEPLTVRDVYSRFILATRIVQNTTAATVKAEFIRLFRKYGIPSEIHCDNGSPFICVQARGGLTTLSAWWVSLGIRVTRSRVACPQDNGAHERMHADLRADVEAMPEANRRRQQRACDRWRREFNEVRPHEALGGKTPSKLYRAGRSTAVTPRPYTYPAHFIPRRTTSTGMFKLEEHNYRASRALVSQLIALEPIDALHCRLWFRELDLGLLNVTPPDAWLDTFVERTRLTKAAIRKRRPRSQSPRRNAATKNQHLSVVAS
jgi:putative transposase